MRIFCRHWIILRSDLVTLLGLDCLSFVLVDRWRIWPTYSVDTGCSLNIMVLKLVLVRQGWSRLSQGLSWFGFILTLQFELNRRVEDHLLRIRISLTILHDNVLVKGDLVSCKNLALSVDLLCYRSGSLGTPLRIAWLCCSIGWSIILIWLVWVCCNLFKLQFILFKNKMWDVYWDLLSSVLLHFVWDVAQDPCFSLLGIRTFSRIQTTCFPTVV